MFSSQLLLEMNNQAVSLLQQNKNGEAITFLRQGLQLLLKNDAAKEQHIPSKGSNGTNSSLSEPQASIQGSMTAFHQAGREDFSARIESVPVVSTGCETVTNSSTSEFEMYNRVVVISLSEPGFDAPEPSMYYQSMVVAVYLYNLGFLCHRDGIQRGCSAALHRAIKVYDIAVAYLSLEGFETFYARGKEVVLFALVSNLCHIHSYFFNRDEAGRCRAYLLGNLPLYTKILSREDYMFVCMNVLLSRQSIPETAPSA